MDGGGTTQLRRYTSFFSSKRAALSPREARYLGVVGSHCLFHSHHVAWLPFASFFLSFSLLKGGSIPWIGLGWLEKRHRSRSAFGNLSHSPSECTNNNNPIIIPFPTGSDPCIRDQQIPTVRNTIIIMIVSRLPSTV